MNFTGNIKKSTILICFFINIKLSLFSALNGTYTIKSSGGNYSTISAAISALYAQGVNGPVIFNVYPETFNEHVVLDGSITGASSVNSITFRNDPNFSGNPIVQFSPTATDDFGGSSNGNVIKFNNTGFINLKGIKTIVLSSNYKNQEYGGVISILNSNHIKVESCEIVGNSDFTNSDWFNRPGIKLYTSQNCLIKSNSINSINNGVVLYRGENCIVEKNVISVSSSGFYGYECDRFDVFDNKIYSSGTNGNVYVAFVIQNSMGANANGYRLVYNNFIKAEGSGLLIVGNEPGFKGANRNFIMNNSISANSVNAINMIYGDSTNLINNIIQIDNGNIITSVSSSSGVEIKNNNFHSISSPFNCSIESNNYSSIASLSGIIGYNFLDNLNINPQFVDLSVNNLHAQNTALVNAGNNNLFGFYSSDIDGEPHIGNPDIGADELPVGGCNPLSLKVFIEGTFNGIEMNTILKIANLVPTNQPFNNGPWNYNGTEQLTSTSNDVVDWVLVEARGTDKCTVLARKAAILLKNGLVVNSDGSCGLTFSSLSSGSYYFVVRHRNHIAVISNSSISYPFISTYDFTSSLNQALSSVQKLVNGKACLISGDINADGIISVADYNIYIAQTSAINQYLSGDLNLDKNVTVADFNIYQANTSTIGPTVIRLSGAITDCGYLSPILPPSPPTINLPVIYNDWILPSKLNDGKVFISVKFGTAPYTYIWNKITSTGTLGSVVGRSEDLLNVATGVYQVTI